MDFQIKKNSISFSLSIHLQWQNRLAWFNFYMGWKKVLIEVIILIFLVENKNYFNMVDSYWYFRITCRMGQAIDQLGCIIVQLVVVL